MCRHPYHTLLLRAKEQATEVLLGLTKNCPFHCDSQCRRRSLKLRWKSYKNVWHVPQRLRFVWIFPVVFLHDERKYNNSNKVNSFFFNPKPPYFFPRNKWNSTKPRKKKKPVEKRTRGHKDGRKRTRTILWSDFSKLMVCREEHNPQKRNVCSWNL